jgi:hypothetical protein
VRFESSVAVGAQSDGNSDVQMTVASGNC